MKKNLVIYSFLIALLSSITLSAQYSVGASAGYYRAGFMTFHKKVWNYDQNNGLRDGYGANIFLEFREDSSKNVVKLEVGYSHQNTFLDLVTAENGGKGPPFLSVFGHKVHYAFDFVNLNLLYSRVLVKRNSFSMDGIIGLSLMKAIKYTEKGTSWHSYWGYVSDSTGQYNKDSSYYENWVLNDVKRVTHSLLNPTIGLEFNYSINSKIDFIFQSRCFLTRSPLDFNFARYLWYFGAYTNVGLRFKL